MCLIALAWNAHPAYRLVLAGNRDERHDRTAAALHWWPEADGILAGRDLVAGGTWLAVSRLGRFAAVTNYRERPVGPDGPRSRGELVLQFVAGDDPPAAFLAGLPGDAYAGFSLLVSDGATLWYASNRGDRPTALGAGVYGLSNASLDTPWPKLLRSRRRLELLMRAHELQPESLLDLLADRKPPGPDERDVADLPADAAAAFSAPFIVGPDYGTRCTTALLWTRDGRFRVTERSYDRRGEPLGEATEEFATDMVQAAE